MVASYGSSAPPAPPPGSMEMTTRPSSHGIAFGMTQRYWLRRPTPLAWWPGGLPLVLVLPVLFLIGAVVIAPNMEEQTAERVQAVLAADGLSDFSVEADGQRVVVRAVETEADPTRVRRLASNTACDTWVAGALTCPTRVRVEMRPPAPESRHHDFVFHHKGETVRLTGEVPSAAVREQILAGARARFRRVLDELVLTLEPATEGYEWAADRSWSILSAMHEGQTTWQDGVLSARGRVSAKQEMTARETFRAGGYPERLGELDLAVIREAVRCNERFAAVFEAATVEFPTGSAEIPASSMPLIRRLAEIARGCPMDLRINGHTDDTGSLVKNQRLSLARARAIANAMAALGVDRSRLSARGYGYSQPVANNATEAGRARNRRIEIEAMDVQPR